VSGKIRLLHFITTTHIGGTERMLINLHSKLDFNRFDSVVVSLFPSEGMLFEELDLLGLKTCSLNYRKYNILSVIIRLIMIIKQNKIDIVQSYGLKTAVISRIVKFFCQIKLISSIRGVDLHRNRFMVWLDRYSSGMVDLFISNSYVGKEVATKREHFSDSSIKVIHNGIDIGQYKESGIIDVYDSEKLNILVLANIWPVKGHKNIIESIKYLRKKNFSVHFYFLGKDHMRGEVQQYVIDNKADDLVTFLGYKKEVVSYIKGADVMLLASLHEGLPTSIIESMLCETIVVATRVGGVGELITDRETGLLIDASSPQQIALAINWIMENKDKVLDIIEKAKKKIERDFSLEDMILQYEQQYIEVKCSGK
jgi:glycosyltransferase involved in cell wall biosynthesis